MSTRVSDRARSNFILGVTHETLWGFGFGLVHPYTILPLAWLDLGGSPWLAGVLPALLYFGMNVPQALSALLFPPRYTEPKRTALLNVVAVAGPLLATLAFLFLPGATPLKRGVFLLGFLLLYAGMGIVVPHWMAAMARCIPSGTRGRYFGTCFFFSNGVGVVAGFSASAWAVKGGLAWGYALASGLSVLFFLASLWVMSFMRPTLPAPKPLKRRTLLHQFAHLAEEWAGNPALMAVVGITVLFMASTASASFFTVFVKETLLTDKRWFMLYTPAMSLGAMVGAFVLGHLSDHQGPRSAILTTFVVVAGSLAGIALLPAGPWHAVSFFGAGFGGSFFVVTMVIVLKHAGEKRNTYLTGFVNTTLSPFNIGVPILWGWMAGEWGYRLIFGLSGLACLAGFIWILKDRTFDADVGIRRSWGS